MSKKIKMREMTKMGHACCLILFHFERNVKIIDFFSVSLSMTYCSKKKVLKKCGIDINNKSSVLLIAADIALIAKTDS